MAASHEEGTGTWTSEEHERFLNGIALYPNGPWKCVAAIVKTRTVRQLRTHAQKYREKLARRERRTQGSMTSSEPDSVEEFEAFALDPIAFSRQSVQYDDCLEFLLEAFGEVEYAL